MSKVFSGLSALSEVSGGCDGSVLLVSGGGAGCSVFGGVLFAFLVMDLVTTFISCDLFDIFQGFLCTGLFVSME